MYIVQLGSYIRSMLCACKRDERIYFRCFHQVYIKENWCSGGNHNSSQIFSLLQWEEEEGLEQFEKCSLSVNENWHGCWSCLLVVRKTLIGFFGSTPSFISFLSRFSFTSFSTLIPDLTSSERKSRMAGTTDTAAIWTLNGEMKNWYNLTPN